MGGDSHNQPVPVGHQHSDPIPAQVCTSHGLFRFSIAPAFPHAHSNFALRIQGMVLLPVFASLRRNSVKMALPKVATSPSITRAFSRIEVQGAAVPLSLSCRLISVLRAWSNGCARNDIGRYDLRIRANCPWQSQDQVLLNNGFRQPVKFHVHFAVTTLPRADRADTLAARKDILPFLQAEEDLR
jgi:hypothetical protein